MKKSLLDYAHDYVLASSGTCTFQEIWASVCEAAELDEAAKAAKVSQFYTNLLLDGRFVILENNTWDLRTRTKFEKISERTAMYNDEEETVDGYDPEEDDREDFFGSSFDDKDDEETEKEENE